MVPNLDLVGRPWDSEVPLQGLVDVSLHTFTILSIRLSDSTARPPFPPGPGFPMPPGAPPFPPGPPGMGPPGGFPGGTSSRMLYLHIF